MYTSAIFCFSFLFSRLEAFLSCTKGKRATINLNIKTQIMQAFQSTYPACCICINLVYLRATGAALIYMYVFVDNLYLRMLGQLYTWAESTRLAVGAVDRHGQQKCTICDARGPCQRNRSVLKPVFRWFRQIHCVYELLRYLDLEMWRFSWWQRQQTDNRQNRLLYPLRMRMG